MKSHRSKVFAALLLVAITAPAGAQSRVEMITTALNHFSIVEMPAGMTVENVAVGCRPSEIQVQWEGRNVLVKPLKPGIRTDMAIFTNTGKIYSYEILPAGKPAEMSMVIREYDAAAQSAARKEEEINEVREAEADKFNTRFLMTAKAIDTRQVRKPKHGINVKVMLVGKDGDTEYVRFHVSNDGNHTYRVEAPRAEKIDPVFGFGEAYKNIDRQINAKEFRKFKAYQEEDIEVLYASITKQDLTPDTATDFVLALQKPPVSPAIYRFVFPSDDGVEVNAVAIF